MKRKQLSKKIRFEVFKRDSFTCQYCGRKSPEVILQCDHIKPISKGGTNDILNLTTSCVDCNSGKSNRELSDSSVINKQREQLEELQERKEQIELMFEWQKGLLDLDNNIIENIASYWSDQTSGYWLKQRGINDIKKLLRKFTVNEILSAIRKSTEQYLRWEDDTPTHESVEIAWKRVGGICKMAQIDKENPNLRRLYYIRGILRNRFNYVKESQVMPLLKESIALGASLDSLEDFAKNAKHWTHWRNGMEDFINDNNKNA